MEPHETKKLLHGKRYCHSDKVPVYLKNGERFLSTSTSNSRPIPKIYKEQTQKFK